MPTILCYGDSLTWGQRPGGGRHTRADRWPTALAEALGPDLDADILAEGLPGRTTAFDTHTSPEDRNGMRLLPTFLSSHAPLDLLILQLGTNDVLLANRTADQAAEGLASLIRCAAFHPYPGMAPPPEVLVIPPLTPGSGTLPAPHAAQCAQLPGVFAARAEALGASVCDADSLVQVADQDGLHLDAVASRALGAGLALYVRTLLPGA